METTKRAIFSLDENEFVNEIPKFKDRGYIIEDLDKAVLVLYSEGNEPLELNNWEPYDPIVFEYFRDESKRFMYHLDYFGEDNPHYLESID